MFSLFDKIRKGKKGQLATFLTVILIIFIILAFISVNLGKIGLQRTRSSNASDAAALAAGSAASALLNVITDFNDSMVNNFLGFTLSAQLQMISWMIDVVKLAVKISKALANPTEWGQGIALGLLNLGFTTSMMALQIAGARKMGEAVEGWIDEKVKELPKTTRNTARLYAFMNAGIDEPKIGYAQWRQQQQLSDTEVNWEKYLNVESKFGKFMREFSQTNKNDPNLGESTLSFSWQDQRGVSTAATTVTNTVEVKITPFSLNLETLNFGEVAGSKWDSVLYDIAVKGGGWDVKNLAILAVSYSPLLLIQLSLMRIFMWLIILVLAIIAVAAAALEAAATTCCIVSVGLMPPCCLEMLRLEGVILACVVGSTAALALMVIIDSELIPQNIPCLVRERGTSEKTIAVEIKRISSPATLNYGVWQMRYPVVSSFSKAKLVDGEIFPPRRKFDAELSEVK